MKADAATAYVGLVEEVVDPREWDASPLSRPEEILTAAGFRVDILTIAPLGHGWDTPLPPDTFRCGAGPIEALSDALGRVRRGEADAVVIRGEDRLRTGYPREERHRLMAIYGDTSIPEAYTKLAEHFCEQRGISAAELEVLADALFENYLRTHRGREGESAPLPHSRWFEKVTRLFRGVDCSNPLIDYRGQAVIVSERCLDLLSTETGPRIEVLGVGLGEVENDGPEHAEVIARYDHLEEALGNLADQTGLCVSDLVLENRCLLEAYTCYPVVPLAFLLASGLAAEPSDIEPMLARVSLTVTGGMNLARGPWNCPALRGLIGMCRELSRGVGPYGLVLGNGGLGYRQGAALVAAR